MRHRHHDNNYPNQYHALICSSQAGIRETYLRLLRLQFCTLEAGFTTPLTGTSRHCRHNNAGF